MLSSIRGFAKTWFAKVLFSLIMISFLAIGARTGVSSVVGGNDVVEAGARQISGADFKRMFDNYMQQLDQQNGRQISPAEAVANGVDKRVLQEIANDEAELAYVHGVGVHPADQLIAEALRQQRDFINPVTGRFDAGTYRDRLSKANLTPAKYEGLLRDQIARDQFGAAIAAGLRAPASYGAMIAGYELESRSLSYFIIDPRHIPPIPAPTDAQLQTFMKQNSARLMRPEMRTLTVVRFSAKALAPSMPVDEAAVRKLYDFRKEAASAPEKRTLVELPTKDAASAAAAARRIKAGETPAAVAKSLGLSPIAYSEQPKTAIVDPKVADVAFALASGEVSGPIPGALGGVPIVVVQSVTPAKTADFAAMRPALEAQARTDAAGQKIYDQVQKFQDAHGGGASIADAAKAAGVTPMTVGPVSAAGADVLGQPVAEATPKLLKDAFNLPPNGETDVENDGTGEYFLVRVDAIAPPALPSLQDANVRQAVARVYMIDEASRRLTARADELADQLRKGQSLEAVATSVGATVSHAPGITRVGMAKNQTLSAELLDKMFSAKAGDVITGPTNQVAVMVAHVDSVQPVAPAAGASLAAGQARQLAGQIFQDMSQAVRTAAYASVKPRVYPDRALSALGLSPDDLPKSAAAPKSGGPAQ